MIINCRVCNKRFEATPYQIKRGKKYCSFKCRNKAYKGRIVNPRRYKKCEICNKPFKAKAGRSEIAKYCSRKCNGIAHLGIKFSLQVRKQISKKMKEHWKKSPNRWYKLHRSGKDSPSWKGGRTVRRAREKEYILIKNRNHPLANGIGYVYEHRLVMEKMIGRYLRPEERVHHINNKPSDNRPENLKLFNNNSEHRKFHGLK